MAEVHGSRFAEHIDLWFRTILFGLRAKAGDWTGVPGGETGFTKLVDELKAIQGGDTFTIWSRELASIWAAKEAQITMSPEEAIAAADLYWQCIAGESALYPDAEEFLALLHDRNIPYHIFTSSDARLCWENGAWVYDAAYALEKKLKRMKHSEALGIKPASVTIGDPEDKPSEAFYLKMMHAASRACGQIDHKRSITVGDSFIGDVKIPLTMLGFARGYWIPSRSVEAEQIDGNIFIISKLTDIDLS